MKRYARPIARSGLALSMVLLLAGCPEAAEDDIDSEDLPEVEEQEPVLDGEDES